MTILGADWSDWLLHARDGKNDAGQSACSRGSLYFGIPGHSVLLVADNAGEVEELAIVLGRQRTETEVLDVVTLLRELGMNGAVAAEHLAVDLVAHAKASLASDGGGNE